MSATPPPGERLCASCGYTNVGTQSTCLHCGTALPAAEIALPGTVVTAASAAPTPGTCRSCGGALGSGDAFCTACGAPVG